MVRVVLREHVGAGARAELGAEVLVRRAPREHRRRAARPACRSTRHPARQVEGDGVRLRVDHDALGEIAGRRRLEALVGADDHAVEAARGRRVHLEDALERPQEVARLHRRAGRVLDALAQLERPRLAAVGRLGDGDGEIRHLLEGLRPRGVLERDQAVLRGLVELPVLERVVDLRVERAAGPLREQLERAAAMLRHQRRAALRSGRRGGARCLCNAGASGCNGHGHSDRDRDGDPVVPHRAPSARAGRPMLPPGPPGRSRCLLIRRAGRKGW